MKFLKIGTKIALTLFLGLTLTACSGDGKKEEAAPPPPPGGEENGEDLSVMPPQTPPVGEKAGVLPSTRVVTLSEPVTVIQKIEIYRDEGENLEEVRKFEYDSLGRLKKERKTMGADLEKREYGYSVDNSRADVAVSFNGELQKKEAWYLDSSGRSKERYYFEAGSDQASQKILYTYPDENSRLPSVIRFYYDGDGDGTLDEEPASATTLTFDAAGRPQRLQETGISPSTRDYEFDTHGCVDKINIVSQRGGRSVQSTQDFNCNFEDESLASRLRIDYEGGDLTGKQKIFFTEYDAEGNILVRTEDNDANGTTERAIRYTYTRALERIWPYDRVPDPMQDALWGE